MSLSLFASQKNDQFKWDNLLYCYLILDNENKWRKTRKCVLLSATYHAIRYCLKDNRCLQRILQTDSIEHTRWEKRHGQTTLNFIKPHIKYSSEWQKLFSRVLCIHRMSRCFYYLNALVGAIVLMCKFYKICHLIL